MADKNELRGHEYDGIQEYDNDLPRWWVNIFWLTTIFGIVYLVWTHGFKEEQHAQLARELSELEAQRAAVSAASGAGQIGDEQLLSMSKDAAVLAKGAEIFMTKCLACHGPQGQGLIGPNLTDNFWIHGGRPTDLLRTVTEGVPAKGMISWKTMMSGDEMNTVVAYVLSLKGSNPPNPKAPEGQPEN